MKGGLYYHPDRIKDVGSPLLLDKGRHDNVEYFLQLIENIAPEVIKDLESLTGNLDIARKWFEEKKLDFNSSPSEWDLVKKSEQDKSFSGYAPLKDGLLNWAIKYNLEAENDYYIVLALWALDNFYEYIQEEDRKERTKDAIEYAKHFKIPEEIAVDWYFSRIRINSKPYEENLSLSDTLHRYEVELDDSHLEESTGMVTCNLNRRFFGSHFPFVFAPSKLDLMLLGLHTYSFEEILDYDHRKTFMFRESMDGKDMKSYEPRDWPSGTGWDPRTETWKEFEDNLDKWFATYKKLYRERTEKFMEQHGYVKGKEKRNQEHFKWLVHYQIQGWSLRQIAEHYEDEELSEDTIFRGVKSASEIVMLNLRPSNRVGRPRSVVS
ncbi:hypothetical protein ACJ7K1_21990 [Paenibacillus elgii]